MVDAWVTRVLIALAFTAALLLLSPIAAGQETDQPLDGLSTADQQQASAGGWGWIPMPKISMPKIEMPKMADSALAPIKSSAQKVSSGAKKAWQGTKELFSFARGGSAEKPAPRVASREQPSFWQRLVGGPPEPEGPETIGDFISAERPR